MDIRKRRLMAAGLALVATSAVLIAHGEGPGNPILDYIGGVGNPNLAVPTFHFNLGPTPVAANTQRNQDHHLVIVDPADEAMVFNSVGHVPVQLAIAPELAGGDKIELLLDGLPADSPSGSLEASLAGVTRGRHRLQARIIDASGNVASVSPSSSFYLWQASSLLPLRR